MTECSKQRLLFQGHRRREVTAAFDGGRMTSDGGGLLLREVEERFGIVRCFAECFTDHRDPELIEFSVEELLRQRVMGLALGYDDLHDYDELRRDPLLALLAGRNDITGDDRRDPQDRGKPLSGKSTLNRFELTPAGANAKSRYKKIVAHLDRLQDTLVEVFIRMRSKQGVPQELVLDLDATDDPVHGDQLGKFFHAYYGHYCYLPLYIFCQGWPLLALLRPSNIDASAGSVVHLRRIVGRLRAAWPGVRIVIRGDSGFCREPIMRFGEETTSITCWDWPRTLGCCGNWMRNSRRPARSSNGPFNRPGCSRTSRIRPSKAGAGRDGSSGSMAALSGRHDSASVNRSATGSGGRRHKPPSAVRPSISPRDPTRDSWSPVSRQSGPRPRPSTNSATVPAAKWNEVDPKNGTTG